MKHMVRWAGLGLVAAVLAAAPMAVYAQVASTNTPAADAPAPKAKKKGTLPFHGKIATIDASAATFTVGDLVLNVTSKSKITSTNAVPAALADFKVGDEVSGAYKKGTDGKLNVTTLHEGGKAKKKKKTAADAAAQ